MTYEAIEAILQSNHFYPGRETTGAKITGLYITAATIRMADIEARIKEVLKDNGVKAKVWGDSNQQKIFIEKK